MPDAQPTPRRRVEDRDAATAGGEPRLDERPRALRLAMKEPDAHGEHDVEAPLAEVEVLQPGDEELRRPGRDVRSVAPRRRGDHLRRAIDRGQPPAVEPLADERRRDPMPAADLEDPVHGPDPQPFDHRSQPLAHMQIIASALRDEGAAPNEAWCYTRRVPTTRPRYTVTDTAEVSEMLDLAHRAWPEVTDRKQLLLRLAATGRDASTAARRRGPGAATGEQIDAMNRAATLMDIDLLLSDAAWK